MNGSKEGLFLVWENKRLATTTTTLVKHRMQNVQCPLDYVIPIPMLRIMLKSHNECNLIQNKGNRFLNKCIFSSLNSIYVIQIVLKVFSLHKNNVWRWNLFLGKSIYCAKQNFGMFEDCFSPFKTTTKTGKKSKLNQVQ